MEPNKTPETTEPSSPEHTPDMPVATPPPETEEQKNPTPEAAEPAAPVAADAAVPSVAPADIQDVEHEEPPVSEKPAKITAPIFVSKSYTFPEILTSLGFASMFLVYAAVAYLHPDVLQTAYLQNDLGKNIGHAALAVEVSMFVNLFLGALLLLGRRKATVYALAGTWLIVLAVFKVLNLLG